MKHAYMCCPIPYDDTVTHHCQIRARVRRQHLRRPHPPPQDLRARLPHRDPEQARAGAHPRPRGVHCAAGK